MALVRRPIWPAPIGRRMLEWPERLFDFPEWFEEEAIKVEESVEGGKLVVKAELPGVDPDKDIELTVSDDVLTIRAERRREEEVEEKGRFRSEFRYGSFTRVVPLPAGATATDVEASYADGILTVKVPVDRGRAEAVKVPIQRG
ncbi:MAG: Hsp20/alpha crystallin family protein [Acidimicrobiales bacterium]|nr:Hsp20/alpha crystallin family protein [Acidimicrobiales bacterium]